MWMGTGGPFHCISLCHHDRDIEMIAMGVRPLAKHRSNLRNETKNVTAPLPPMGTRIRAIVSHNLTNVHGPHRGLPEIGRTALLVSSPVHGQIALGVPKGYPYVRSSSANTPHLKASKPAESRSHGVDIGPILIG